MIITGEDEGKSTTPKMAEHNGRQSTSADSERLYVLEANRQVYNSMYRSDDAGETFATIKHEENLLGSTPKSKSGQAPIDMAIAVSPTDPDEVHVGGITTFRSMDGGYTFEQTSKLGRTNKTGYCHPDVDILVYLKDTLYIGTDGGFSISQDKAESFEDRSVGLGIRQFYRIGVSQTDPVIVGGGSQDNGSSIYFGQTNTWRDWLGGDGMETFIDWSNPQVIYGEWQLGGASVTRDQGLTLGKVRGIPEFGEWVTPFAQDPEDPEVLYIGAKDVLKHSEAGDFDVPWEPISNFKENAVNPVITVMKIAPSNNQVIYVAMHKRKPNSNDPPNGHLKKTEDGGKTWVDLEEFLPEGIRDQKIIRKMAALHGKTSPRKSDGN